VLSTKTHKGIALFDEVGAELGIVCVDVWERYRTAAAQLLAKASPRLSEAFCSNFKVGM
jgi:hypothetical protein